MLFNALTLFSILQNQKKILINKKKKQKHKNVNYNIVKA